MTGANSKSDRRQAPNGSSNEPYVLPEWALSAIRPMGRAVSSLLWGLGYHGLENIPDPANGGLLIASNHQTYIDPFWVGIPIKRPLRYLAWNRIWDWPIVGKWPGWLGAWPLEVEGSDPRAIRKSVQWLRSGGAVVIFPEGGRGMPDGSLIKFKPGAVRLALESNVPILPVTIRGGHRVWPSSRKFPTLRKREPGIEVVFHPTYNVTANVGEESRAAARRASEQITEIIGSALRVKS